MLFKREVEDKGTFIVWSLEKLGGVWSLGAFIYIYIIFLAQIEFNCKKETKIQPTWANQRNPSENQDL